MTAVVAAIGTMFAPAAAGGAAVAAGGAAAAAGGIFAAGGAGWSVLGGIASGLGSAMLQKKEAAERERMQIGEEQRLADSYAGSGEATRFWDQQANDSASIDPEYQRPDAMSNSGNRVGQKETKVLPGQQYRLPDANQPKQPKRYYDRATGQIVST